MSDEECIFCKIIRGEIPSTKIYETDDIYAFMDIQPLSEGHCLFIPKKHAQKMHEADNGALSEILIAIKKVAKALDLETYNILQNNGRLAHQAVDHVHFHLIPKPNSDRGLKIQWNPIEDAAQETVAERIRKNISQ